MIDVFSTRAISGSDANIWGAFDAAQDAAISNGFSGLYLVADHIFWGPIDRDLLGKMQPRAITAFAPVNPSQGVPENPSLRPIAGVEQLDPRSPAYPYGFGLQPLQLLKQKLP